MRPRFANPYLAGIALGLVLLSAFLLVGHGLGASGASYRLGVAALGTIAPGHVEHSTYMAPTLREGNVLESYYVLLGVGTFLGGAVSAYAAGRMQRTVLRGPRIGVAARLSLALAGGILMGAAARLTRGCTSGQALSGGALLSVGSWIFMLSVFAGGYALAYFVRRQWT